MRRLNVLLSAYACEPGRGSEEGVGWSAAVAAARDHDVWVLTHPRHRDGIQRELAARPVENLRVVYPDVPRAVGFFQERLGGYGYNLTYYAWQVAALARARSLLRTVRFDVAHHVTWVRYWQPSFLALLAVPFVWGPVGGAETAPAAFWPTFSRRGRVEELLRTAVRAAGERDPFVRLTARRSALCLATTRETADRLRAIGARRVELMSEAALGEADLTALGTPTTSQGGPAYFLSAGRLLHWKGYHLALRAFAAADLPRDSRYWVVGDGPERGRLEELARGLGIGERVVFLGRVPRPEVLQMLGRAVAFVHPSLHDSGGWACLEAMATGKPVVCLDLGGPGQQVTGEAGVKIAAGAPDQVVRELGEAMARLARDPAMRGAMGEAGRRRVRTHYGWARKIERQLANYESVLAP